MFWSFIHFFLMFRFVDISHSFSIIIFWIFWYYFVPWSRKLVKFTKIFDQNHPLQNWRNLFYHLQLLIHHLQVVRQEHLSRLHLIISIQIRIKTRTTSQIQMMNKVINYILSIDTFKQPYVVLKVMLYSPRLEDHMKTNGIDQSLKNRPTVEHKFLNNIKNINMLVSVMTNRISRIFSMLLWFLLQRNSLMSVLVCV